MDIHKAGGVLIKDRKLLVERSKDKEFFIAPGGSIEDKETSKQALVRELLEEFKIVVSEDNLEEFGTFYAKAAGNESKQVTMDVFLVNDWEGDPEPDNEVEELAWIDSNIPSDIKVGSIFEHEVIPKLKQRGLID
jgi:8-oxo-dGTP pyrophosphatase MutT (NUDIX family)